jgi:hypothetical protein
VVFLIDPTMGRENKPLLPLSMSQTVKQLLNIVLDALDILPAFKIGKTSKVKSQMQDVKNVVAFHVLHFTFHKFY